MTILRTTIIAAALLMGTASASYAQDMGDKAKSMAVKEGKKIVKDKAHDVAVDAAGEVGGDVSDTAVDMGADMIKGKSIEDAAMGAAMKTGKAEMGVSSGASISTGEAMTAGKVMMGGGSVQDAAIEVAKDRVQAKAEGMVMEEAGKILQGGDIQAGADVGAKMDTKPTSAPMTAPVSAPAPAPAALPVNCPYGTTAQPNGTCMITGDYNG